MLLCSMQLDFCRTPNAAGSPGAGLVIGEERLLKRRQCDNTEACASALMKELKHIALH